MDVIDPPLRDRRHVRRYWALMRGHMQQATATSSGPATRDGPRGFAATQAAWRFFNNGRVEPSALAAPLQQAGRDAAASGARPLLLVHDWTHLSFGAHEAKPDTAQRSHGDDVGYDLATALLVSGDDGAPLAPMQMHMAAADGMHSSSESPPAVTTPAVDQVRSTMDAACHWDLPRSLVHVIDRECDSVGHYRQWDEAGHWFLVRGDDRCVWWHDQEWHLSQVVDALAAADAFGEPRAVTYHNQSAWQYVAETAVTLHRPARHYVDGKQRAVAGRALPLRLVVSRVCDERGDVLATWLLLTNVPRKRAAARTIAQWYYWRWQIESFFKLLKSHGQQVEHWQQQTAGAIFRRLLVAAMACVCVWDLQRQQSRSAERLKDLLIRLSGRQTTRDRPFTAPALLQGLFVLLPMLELLAEYDHDLTTIQQLVEQNLPFLKPG